MGLLETNRERVRRMNQIIELANSLPPDSAIDVLKKFDKIMVKTTKKLRNAIRNENLLNADVKKTMEAIIHEAYQCQYSPIPEDSDIE